MRVKPLLNCRTTSSRAAVRGGRALIFNDRGPIDGDSFVALTAEQKKEILGQYGLHDTDTGSPAAPNAIACGKSVVPETRMEAPRSKSDQTIRGVLAIRCMRFRNAASAYGSAFCTPRGPLALVRISPPTLVSRISRTNFW